ncbi:nucleotidyltransferase domain-containing protein [Candidatus Pacearchaeota archaeon]|nr:nucleotidyltransferase domain-containing protein [Candidatus Pacearchaeota archaeon]
MEIQIKKAVKAGNSSAVILPRAWLNQEVRIELIKKTPEIILHDVLNITKKYIPPEEIIGIYLAGSYARNEETEESDIDILIITKDTDKEMIKEGIYSILIVSEALLMQKLKNNLFPIGQMIKEAIPLLNSAYLKFINIKITKKNVKWYIDTTQEKIDLVEEFIKKAEKKNKKYLEDRIAYTLILRIRTLYIIEKLAKNKDYSSKEFTKLIKNKSKNAYSSYLAIKNNSKKTKGIILKDAEILNIYLKNQLNNVKKMLK